VPFFGPPCIYHIPESVAWAKYFYTKIFLNIWEAKLGPMGMTPLGLNLIKTLVSPKMYRHILCTVFIFILNIIIVSDININQC